MKKALYFILLVFLSYPAAAQSEKDNGLAYSFDNPAMSAKPACFWWWFNSLVDEQGITRDLDREGSFDGMQAEREFEIILVKDGVGRLESVESKRVSYKGSAVLVKL